MYILKVAYDGRYSFQQQPHKQTVCDKILDVLDELNLLEERKIIYSGGRTDKGVSALGNFVVVNLKKEPILSYINHKLKDYGIWVLGFKEITFAWTFSPFSILGLSIRSPTMFL